MELISFIIASGIGLVLTFYSIKEKSHVFGVIASLFFLMIGMSLLLNGLTERVMAVTVETSGNVTTTFAENSLFDDGIFTNTLLGLLFVGLFVFVGFSSGLALYEERKG
jgi:hypothetical protein